MIKRSAIYTILVLTASNLIGQAFISGINLSNKNDSIWMIEEYFPTEITKSTKPRQSYDFSSVSASCASLLKVEKEGTTLMTTMNDSKAKEGYRVEREGFRSLAELSLIKLFEPYGKVKERNISPEALVTFPLVEEEYEVSQFWLYSITEFKEESLKKYDSIVCQVKIRKKVSVSDKMEFNFSFGSRLAISVESDDNIELVSLIGYRAKKSIQLPLNLIDTQSFSTRRSTLEVFNSYRGVLLAKAEFYDGRLERVRIFEEVLGRGKYRPCGPKDEEFQLYPNPSYGNVNVFLSSQLSGNYQFVLYNVIGMELYSRSLLHDTSIAKYNIELPNPRKGTYLYSIIDPNGTRLFTRRLIIVDL